MKPQGAGGGVGVVVYRLQACLCKEVTGERKGSSVGSICLSALYNS